MKTVEMVVKLYNELVENEDILKHPNLIVIGEGVKEELRKRNKEIKGKLRRLVE